LQKFLNFQWREQQGTYMQNLPSIHYLLTIQPIFTNIISIDSARWVIDDKGLESVPNFDQEKQLGSFLTNTTNNNFPTVQPIFRNNIPIDSAQQAKDDIGLKLVLKLNLGEQPGNIPNNPTKHPNVAFQPLNKQSTDKGKQHLLYVRAKNFLVIITRFMLLLCLILIV
jgi:hypothetical protein